MDVPNKKQQYVKDIVLQFNYLEKCSLKRNIELPYVTRINTINTLISEDLYNESSEVYPPIFPSEIWLFVIIPNLNNFKDYLSLIFVSKYFYKTNINALIKFIPLYKKINYIIKQNKKVPDVIILEDVENFAQKNNINFSLKSFSFYRLLNGAPHRRLSEN